MVNSKKSPKNKTTTASIPLVNAETGTMEVKRGKSKNDKVYISSSVKVDFAGPVKQRSFFTNFTSGKPISKSVRQAAKLNGSKYQMLWSSLNATDFKNPASTAREFNEMVTGFNQKLIYTSKYLTPNWTNIFKDIYGLFITGYSDGVANYQAPTPDYIDNKTAYFNVYGVMKNITSKLVFRNNMNTTSALVKVHLVALRNPTSYADRQYDGPIKAMFTSPTVMGEPIDQHRYFEFGKYPRPYVRTQVGNDITMLTSTPIDTNSHAYYASVAPGVSPLESNSFTQVFSIVKTFTKLLDVGDDWTLSLTHTLGSGLRLDEFLRIGKDATALSTLDSTDFPVKYRIMVEVVGKRITAETNSAYDATYVGEDKFIGTAPCSVNWEATHYASYVLNSYGASIPFGGTDVYLTGRMGGPLVKYYVKDITTPNTVFNEPYWKTNANIVKINGVVQSPLIIKSQTTATVQTVTTTN